MDKHSVAVFFVTLCVFYGVWLFAWPWTLGLHRAVFTQLGEVAVGNVGETGHVRFAAPKEVEHKSDVLLILENSRLPGKQGLQPISSRTLAYLPMGFTLALIAATPTPWHRKLWSLFWGFVLMSLFVGFSLWLQVADKFSGSAGDPFFVYHPGPFGHGALSVTLKVLTKTPVTAYIMPVFIWILVSFRREDVDRLLGASRTASPAPS